MSTAEIKKSLHNYIEEADERFLQLLYGMMEADKSAQPLLSIQEKEELDRRSTNHSQGTSKSYSWKEVKQQIKS